jgi:hypothetical protein
VTFRFFFIVGHIDFNTRSYCLFHRRALQNSQYKVRSLIVSHQSSKIHTWPRYTFKMLAATASRPNPEALAARVVLAHPHAAFHPCMCGLCGGAAMVVVTLIGYDDHGGCAAGKPTSLRRS